MPFHKDTLRLTAETLPLSAVLLYLHPHPRILGINVHKYLAYYRPTRFAYSTIISIHYSLLLTHYFLLITSYSLLITHYFLLFTFYFLLSHLPDGVISDAPLNI